MKPKDQTTFGVPGGNCLSACMASLLHLETDDVPYLQSDDVEPQVAKFATWLKQYGLYPMVLGPNAHVPGFYILCGYSPRGRGTHAVVACGDTLIHDPHPSREGIRGVEKKIVLVPFEPHKWTP